MPFAEVPPSALQHVGMFGFSVLKEDEEFLLLANKRGRQQLVQKARPLIWFDDVEDAMQMGAITIIQTGLQP